MGRQPRRVTVVGGGIGVAQCALGLAELGAEVTIISPFMELGSDSTATGAQLSYQDLLHLRPLLLRAASHPRVTLLTNSRISSVSGKKRALTIRGSKYPRYVREDLCTSCGRCSQACSVKIPLVQNNRWVIHNAIHPSLLGRTAVPSAYSVDKRGISPCRSACPLGINVQGFVSLLSRGKVDAALSLINESAPLAGVLGRVCTHPCEDSCKRAEIDEPVFTKALHRYAADNTSSGIQYTYKARPGSRKEKIAIVGSGPAGLTAAWELARRGYTPTVFEAHAVAGGMLASAIPRFRLPREIRKREVKAIEGMGVSIRTGVTVGRDVTVSDLRERGYRAFFLAIGAHKNSSLDIPGEDLEGVVDSISLLFELNLGVGASVGKKMVVIGGGNSAIDSARTAKRRGKRTVTILYRRTAEEMTAVKEDIEEALKEGIRIEYLTSPVEILGDGTKVTGLRCQRMALGEIGEDGRRGTIPVPGSEFVMDADHVVLAIGQRPNIEQLRPRSIQVDPVESTIRVDPLTLETNVAGVFAGGDCVTGPNNVVEAAAAGLRAAESIDRYLRGRSLTRKRTLDKPEPVDVKVAERYAAPHKRAQMPLIARPKRLGSFEETSMGLSPGIAEGEAERCLNCAVCSGCLECEQACELQAVFHNDRPERIEVEADMIVHYPSSGGDIGELEVRSGIYTVEGGLGDNPWRELAQASYVALDVGAQLGLQKAELEEIEAPRRDEPCDHESAIGPSRHLEATQPRIGVFLCRCGGSISSVVDFGDVGRRTMAIENVSFVGEISQACTEEGALRIAAQAKEEQLDRVVLAACRCCGQQQICFSCTDRRIVCRHYLEQNLTLPRRAAPEFVNIREQCAWVHSNDPTNATAKAAEMVSAAVAGQVAFLPDREESPRLQGDVVIIGSTLSCLSAANQLVSLGYSATVISGPGDASEEAVDDPECRAKRTALLRQLQKQEVPIHAWPELLDMDGIPADYHLVVDYGMRSARVHASAIIVDLRGIGVSETVASDNISSTSLLGRLISHRRYGQLLWEKGDYPSIRELTIGETSGIFLVSSDEEDSVELQIMAGAAAAVRASTYLSHGMPLARANAIIIDRKLCRGCGECAAVCPYIEMRTSDNGALHAHLERALCLGCGACVAHCPTGAIGQPLQADDDIMAMLDALLSDRSTLSEVE